MSSRIRFGEELGYAVRIRGLTLTEVAHRARVAVATASSAIHGRPVNISTALRLAHAVAACPVVAELAEWVVRPPASSFGLRRPAEEPETPTHPDARVHAAPAAVPPVRRTDPSSQLLITLSR